MLSQKAIESIKELTSKYPKKESALMPALMIAQKENDNFIDRELTAEVAKAVGVSEAHAYGVLTYYTMYNTKKVGKYHLQVDTNIPATLMGARKIVETITEQLDIDPGETTRDGMFTLNEVECLASCGTCPVIQVNDVYYENMTPEKTVELINSLKNGVMPERKAEYNFGSECNVLLKNRAAENSTSIDTYKANGGYKALEKALTMEPQSIIDEVKSSAIRGRGGAGFPAGVKWGFLPKNTMKRAEEADDKAFFEELYKVVNTGFGRVTPAKVDQTEEDLAKPVFLICNADEGEPGTFKDRQIMEYDPHLLIEGMVISARAIGAALGFIYIRGEFDWIADILDKAVAEAKADGKLGNFNIIVHRGAGAYVCGEETALIESIEGKRGEPRIKPPFPAVEGLYGCPTIVNNVETLASVPFIVEKGAEAFKAFGYENNTGFKLFGISGNVNKPGVYEYPMGVPFNKLIEAAGGVKGNYMKAAIVGGLSVQILKAEELNDLNMDYDSCIKHGTGLGSGGIMVVNDEFSIPELAYRTIKFYAHESCGRCAPCRNGSDSIVKLLEKIVVDGEGTMEDIDNIIKVCDSVKGVTICPTGEAFSVPIKAMVEKFRDEFESLVKCCCGCK